MPSRDGWQYVACDLEPAPILPAPIDTLYVKTSLFTASLFTFKKFYKMFIFFPTMISIKNSSCAFLARVKTYTHTKN